MKGLLSFSGVVTKVRAMQGRFFDEEDFREIVSLPDVPAVAAYLKKNPNYEEALKAVDERTLHRGQLEYYLRNTILRDFQKIYCFSDSQQRKFLKRYGRRYEVRYLKSILVPIMEGGQTAEESRLFDLHFSRYSDLDMEKLSQARTITEFVEALKGSPYYEPMARVHDTSPQATLFEYETALDLFHFSTIWKDKKEIAGKPGEEALKEFYGTKFDMLNLWYIYRAKKYYNMDNVSVYALTIPVLYHLNKNDIRRLVEAESDNDFGTALKETYYGRIYPALAPDNLQYMYTKICRDVIKEGADKDPYSIASLYQYLYLKEHEVYRLTTALECVRYGLKPEESIRYVMQR
ncbi:MAG: V-type ATPase subunit [Lachnospiraceae bacterium]|nr:V-type ATPase subunit [Lachnospiraceae bacterium]